jgi:integrase
MAGRRALTPDEESRLKAALARVNARDRALVTCQWMTGFRISELLSLTYGTIWRGGQMLPSIGVAPSHLKGGYGRTRWIPILPQLRVALESHHQWLRLRFELRDDLPLFPSREGDAAGRARSLSRGQARLITLQLFAAAGIHDDGRLGTHTLRKTWARRVYTASGNDIMVLRDALGHASVGTSERYLDVGRDRVLEAIRAGWGQAPAVLTTSRRTGRRRNVIRSAA